MRTKLITGIALLLLLDQGSFAQQDSLRYFLGGGTRFSMSGSKSIPDKDVSYLNLVEGLSFRVEASPQFGLIYRPQVILGLEVLLSFEYQESMTGGTYESYSAGVGPFMRYFFNTGSTRPFIQFGGGLGYSYSSLESNQSYSDTEDFSSSLQYLGVGGGVSLFAGSRVAIDLGASYLHLMRTDHYDYNSVKSLNPTLQLGVGVVVLL